jgi:carboxymethylenebutenolidase
MNVMTEQTNYAAHDGTQVATYVARPEGDGPFSALVMGYEFWGMLEVPAGAPHMRDVAARFAAEGYVAIVPDYYAARGKQPTIEGGTIAGSPSDEESTSDLLDAVEWLSTLPYVNAARIGAIGWCGGGRQVLFLAARTPLIRAVASFYGRPVNRPTMLGPSPIDVIGEINAPIFGAYGAADKAIPLDTVERFQEALTAAGKVSEIHIFPGAEHAFANDRRPEGYQPEAAAESWRLVLDFFGRYLRADARGQRRVDVCALEELVDNSVQLVTVARRKVALCRIGDEIFALEDACPHFAGPLSEGKMHAGRRELICPWHRMRFGLTDGCSITNRELVAKTYPATVQDGRVYVTL